MDLIPFNIAEDEDFNEIYRFIFTPDSKEWKRLEDCYKTSITIDGLNDDLLIKEECSCVGFFIKNHVNI